jgi:hypothetical protein
MMKNTKSHDFAVRTLYEWFTENREDFIARGVELEFKDTGRGSAYVRLETKGHLAELVAWDHASCLDIQVMDVNTKQSNYPHTGECESKSAFKYHLKEFINWLQDVEQRIT